MAEKNEPSKDFFISYSTSNRLWAEWIAYTLENDAKPKRSVVLEAWDFRPGEDTTAKLNQATKEAKRVLLLLSKNYLQDPEMTSQWTPFFDRRGQEAKIIPILLEECDVKGLLGPLIPISFIGMSEDQAKTELLNGINPGRATPPTRPAFPSGKGSSSMQEVSTAQLVHEKPPYPDNLEVKNTVDVFLMCAREDEQYRKEVAKSLATLRRQGYIKDWHQGEILGGRDRQQEIKAHFQKSTLFLLLLSPDFLASDEWYNLGLKAVERAQNASVQVVPILIRPCDWKHTDFAPLALLPKNAQAISSWTLKDKAYEELASDIREIVNSLTVAEK